MTYFFLPFGTSRKNRQDMAWNYLAQGEKSSAQKCFAVPWRWSVKSIAIYLLCKKWMISVVYGCL